MGKNKNPLLDEVSKSNKRELKQRDDEIKRLTDLLSKQQDRIDKLSGPRFSMPAGRKGKTSRGAFCRVILGDTHGCWVDKGVFASVLKDIEKINPAEIVMLGDHLDCAGWLAAHHPFQTVQEAKYTFEEDVSAANWALDALQKRAPNAKIHYLEGNHEQRVEAFVTKSTGQNHTDAQYVKKLFSPSAVMHLEKRGINYYERTQRHCGLRLNGLIKLGHCYFLHGFSHGKNAARATLAKVKRNVVFGHVHSWMMAGGADTENDLCAWCPGCLCHLEPMWRHSDPTEWNHGYAVQFVKPNGSFLHITIPIINGESLFIPLTASAA